MEFKLKFDIPSSDIDLTHKDSVVLMGSCFSNEIAGYFMNAGFHQESNTFGILFHPLAIANVLSSTLDNSDSVDITSRNGLFFSWDSASKIYATDEDQLTKNVLTLRKKLNEKLKKSSLLIITFGTAWGYRHKSTNKIVGNCHKASSSDFNKVLTQESQMFEKWSELIEKLKTTNPNLNIIFTVSPVRHTKDGLINNNRSKARLIELAHDLTQFNNASYFPSYEILVDELRDYRFYKKDRVHPTSEATDYVWQKFSDYLFKASTLELNKHIAQIKLGLSHESIHPGSDEDRERVKNLMHRKNKLENNHPEVCWEQKRG
jgi:lysophospholipase L1-like esterase